VCILYYSNTSITTRTGSSLSSSLPDSSRIDFASPLARRASTAADGDGTGTSSSLPAHGHVLFSQAETRFSLLFSALFAPNPVPHLSFPFTPYFTFFCVE
jgi:hypothetical protein